LIYIKKKSPSILEKASFRLRIFYEKLTNVDFTKVTPIEDLRLNPKIVSKCSPSTVKYLFKVLDYLKISKNNKVLDIGCGKGYAIKFFKSLGYQTVDGLEISKKLTMVAKNNFKKININSKIYNINATKFKFYGKYDIFYLYNPFPQNIAENVFFNIKKQIGMKRKRFYIIYANPVAHKVLIKNGFVCKKYFPYIGDGKIAVYFYN
jgi:SAM-dependent methyltransferase